MSKMSDLHYKATVIVEDLIAKNKVEWFMIEADVFVGTQYVLDFFCIKNVTKARRICDAAYDMLSEQFPEFVVE